MQGPLSAFVDRTPLTICAKAPMEYAVEMFGKLGLRYLSCGRGRDCESCSCDYQKEAGLISGVSTALMSYVQYCFQVCKILRKLGKRRSSIALFSKLK